VLPRPRAIIAEDEPLLREELAELLGSLWPELDVVAQTGDGIATLRRSKRMHPISFPRHPDAGLTGLEVARQVSGRCHIVFVTAYDQHTLAAFEQGARTTCSSRDAARLATTVARLKERVGRPAPAIEGLLRELGAPQRGFLRWINASHGPAGASSRGRRVLFPGRQQVHAGGHRRGGIAIRKPIKSFAMNWTLPPSGRFIVRPSSTFTPSPAWCATCAATPRFA